MFPLEMLNFKFESLEIHNRNESQEAITRKEEDEALGEDVEHSSAD